MNAVLIVGRGHRAKMIEVELTAVCREPILVETAEQVHDQLQQKRFDGLIISPEFSPEEVRAIARESRAIAGKRKLHIFAFDEAVEGYETETHPYREDCVDAVIGIFSSRVFKAAYRYVRDRHGMTSVP